MLHLHDFHLYPLGLLWADPSLLVAWGGISAAGGASLDLYKTKRDVVLITKCNIEEWKIS